MGIISGGVPEWPKGADCKSAGSAYGGSNPPPSTMNKEKYKFLKVTLQSFVHVGGNSSGARASAFQAEGRGFESRFPLHRQTRTFGSLDINRKTFINALAHVAQSVEHILGKDEVTSSILVVGSNLVEVG